MNTCQYQYCDYEPLAAEPDDATGALDLCELHRAFVREALNGGVRHVRRHRDGEGLNRVIVMPL